MKLAFITLCSLALFPLASPAADTPAPKPDSPKAKCMAQAARNANALVVAAARVLNMQQNATAMRPTVMTNTGEDYAATIAQDTARRVGKSASQQLPVTPTPANCDGLSDQAPKARTYSVVRGGVVWKTARSEGG